MDYTRINVVLLRETIVAKWRWLERSGSLAGATWRTRQTRFERVIEDAWRFLTGTETKVPSPLLTEALWSLPWDAPEMKPLVEIPEDCDDEEPEDREGDEEDEKESSDDEKDDE